MEILNPFVNFLKSVLPEKIETQKIQEDKRVFLMDGNKVILIDRENNTITFMNYVCAD